MLACRGACSKMKRSSKSPERRATKRHKKDGVEDNEEEDEAYVPYVPLKERRQREVGLYM